MNKKPLARKETQKQKTIKKTKKNEPARCTCTVKLDPTNPISLVGDITDTAAKFTPNYAPNQEPKCAPAPPCEMKNTYKWTIEKSDGNPVLSDDTKETATVTGEGTFKLCVQIKVVCRKPIGFRRENLIYVISSRCEDSQCEEFTIEPRVH